LNARTGLKNLFIPPLGGKSKQSIKHGTFLLRQSASNRCEAVPFGVVSFTGRGTSFQQSANAQQGGDPASSTDLRPVASFRKKLIPSLSDVFIFASLS
jgi:hypothetical protein